MTSFIDTIKLKVKAGDGGNGIIAFLREKYMPHGGPAGGDGGRGGHIIFEGDPRLGTLLDLRYHPIIVAQRGADGMGHNCHGRRGKDIFVKVPLGTAVTDAATGEQIADITEPGQRWMAARGGNGGWGNQHFATATNKTPRFARDGEEGEERDLILELKLIADVGLVGLPNAGKSTLLSKLTSATPKIASYPFTTLSPNLGIMEFDDVGNTDRLQRLTLADIPGLIEGASRGVGLGDRFLRHIERTRILCHLIGDESGTFDPEDMIYKYDLVCAELTAYGNKLASREQVVLLTKIDLANPEDLEKTVEAFQSRGIEPMLISALEGEGLEALKERLRERVEAAMKESANEIALEIPRQDDELNDK